MWDSQSLRDCHQIELKNAIRACHEALWGDRSQRPEFWYVAFHTLFFLDLYLSESNAGFTPPAPFTLDEMDERGLLPERVYMKEKLQKYLEHGREKCRATIASMTEEKGNRGCGFEWLDLSMTVILLRAAYTTVSPGGVLFIPFTIVVIWAIPYLWIRRNDFGIGQ